MITLLLFGQPFYVINPAARSPWTPVTLSFSLHAVIWTYRGGGGGGSGSCSRFYSHGQTTHCFLCRSAQIASRRSPHPRSVCMTCRTTPPHISSPKMSEERQRQRVGPRLVFWQNDGRQSLWDNKGRDNSSLPGLPRSLRVTFPALPSPISTTLAWKELSSGDSPSESDILPVHSLSPSLHSLLAGKHWQGRSGSTRAS